jgi:hypothetical protein
MMMKKRGRQMKKILLYAITMVFGLALSAAYALEEGKLMNNGITDFAGKTIDSLSDLTLAGPGAIAEVEGANAGGIRSEGPAVAWYNGVTVFSGKGINTRTDLDEYFADSFRVDEMKAAMVESSHAGGIRPEEPIPVLPNGITDFSGNTYDSL